MDRTPEIQRVVAFAHVDIDNAGVPSRTPARLPRVPVARQIDRKRQPAVDLRRPIDKPDLFVQPAQLRVGELRRAMAKAQLI